MNGRSSAWHAPRHRRLPVEAVAAHRVAARPVRARQELVRHVQLEIGDGLDEVAAARVERGAHRASSVMPRLAAFAGEERHRDVVGQHRHLVAEQLHLVRGRADDQRDRGRARPGARAR